MKLLFVLCSLFLTSCSSTVAVWEQTSSYEESVLGFYLVEGKSEALVVGDKYNYMFTVSSNLYGTLKLSNQMTFKARFDDFSMDEENKINGNVELFVKKDSLSENDIKALEQLGFEHYISEYLHSTERIWGTLYKAEKEVPVSKTAKNHTVSVTIPDSTLLNASKLVSSPVTITLDALILYPATLIVMFVGS